MATPRYLLEVGSSYNRETPEVTRCYILLLCNRSTDSDALGVPCPQDSTGRALIFLGSCDDNGILTMTRERERLEHAKTDFGSQHVKTGLGSLSIAHWLFYHSRIWYNKQQRE